MIIDGHWHARDEKYPAESVEHSLRVGHAAGLDAIISMPNTSPPLIDAETCKAYLDLANDVDVPVRFFTHIGLTSDPDQIKRAVEASRTIEGIVGMKVYLGRSTGPLSVINADEQRRMWEVLVQEGYDGVVVGHCEKEALMDDTLYDPRDPRTWSTHCRPEMAEIASFLDQVAVLEDLGFAGTFHVAHVSTTDVVDAVANYVGPLRLSCGITPHHFLMSDEYLARPDGGEYKCNPPLRKEATRAALFDRLKAGLIPMIESDHAPHTQEAKARTPPASGIVSGTAWPFVYRILLEEGVPEQRIHALMFEGARAMYGLDVEPKNAPDLEKLGVLKQDYHFDHFRDIIAKHR